MNRGVRRGQGGLSVLLVAESFFVRHYFSRLFEKKHDFWSASSGSEAIEQLSGLKSGNNFRFFDLIFINDYLPDMGAAELLQTVGQSQPEAKTFVLLTHPNDAKPLIERHGASGVITKPFTTGDILKTIRQVLPLERLFAARDLFFPL